MLQTLAGSKAHRHLAVLDCTASRVRNEIQKHLGDHGEQQLGLDFQMVNEMANMGLLAKASGDLIRFHQISGLAAGAAGTFTLVPK